MVVKNNDNELNETQELLLVKYFDGECGVFERWKVRGLLRRSAAAGQFLRSIDAMRDELSLEASGAAGSAAHKESMWDRVSRRIEQEERAEVLLGRRRVFVEPAGSAAFSLKMFGVAGAVAVAFIAFVIFPGNRQAGAPGSGEETALKSEEGLAKVEAPEVKLASLAERKPRRVPRIIDPEFPDVVEVDWLRSEGSVRMIRNKRQPSVILWVKRKDSDLVAPENGLSRAAKRFDRGVSASIEASER